MLKVDSFNYCSFCQSYIATQHKAVYVSLLICKSGQLCVLCKLICFSSFFILTFANSSVNPIKYRCMQASVSYEFQPVYEHHGS